MAQNESRHGAVANQSLGMTITAGTTPKSKETMMGANSTQAFAVVLFLAAFTLLGAAFAMDGSLLFFALFLVCIAVSVAMFLKCKPWEHTEK